MVDNERTTEDAYTLSSPFEPNGSGELKHVDVQTLHIEFSNEFTASRKQAHVVNNFFL